MTMEEKRDNTPGVEEKAAEEKTQPRAERAERAERADRADNHESGERRHDGDDSDEGTRRKRRATVGEAVLCRPLEVTVRDDRVEQAIRQLKNRLAREGVLRELKNRRHFYKPSELKRIKSREAARRRRKQTRQKTR